MEFKSLKNIDTAFRQNRFFSILIICLCCAVTLYTVWNSYEFAEAQRKKIYVFDGDKALMLASAQDIMDDRPVEARSHVKRFHEFFFTFSPDKEVIERNIERAIQMCDKSAYNYYKDLAESGYYNRIITANINQSIVTDSIACNFDAYPYQIQFFGRQYIIRESNITERSLVTRCRLLNTGRSDSNPHGFFIEAFEVIENKDLRILNR